jgi:hypothetical protein
MPVTDGFSGRFVWIDGVELRERGAHVSTATGPRRAYHARRRRPAGCDSPRGRIPSIEVEAKKLEVLSPKPSEPQPTSVFVTDWQLLLRERKRLVKYRYWLVCVLTAVRERSIVNILRK